MEEIQIKTGARISNILQSTVTYAQAFTELVKNSMQSGATFVEITLNEDNKAFLLEKAMLTNSDGNKMDGCWLSLIDNEILLSHVREIDTFDQISLANIIDNFTFKSHEIKKELSLQVDFNKPIENHLTHGILV